MARYTLLELSAPPASTTNSITTAGLSTSGSKDEAPVESWFGNIGKMATSVYTGVTIFPMLPNQLSTGASSLLPDVDRPAVVIEFVVDAGGALSSSNVYRAIVRNKAQLTYNAVGAWLEGTAAAPSKVAASSDLQAQLKWQDQVAQSLKKLRYEHGALNLDTSEIVPLLYNDQVVDVVNATKNRATDLIEDFMVAANGVVARLLEK